MEGFMLWTFGVLALVVVCFERWFAYEKKRDFKKLVQSMYDEPCCIDPSVPCQCDSGKMCRFDVCVPDE